MDDITLRKEAVKLIENHLLGTDPDAERIIDIIKDTNRNIPIRGILENMRKFRTKNYNEHEDKLIDELLYKYG